MFFTIHGRFRMMRWWVVNFLLFCIVSQYLLFCQSKQCANTCCGQKYYSYAKFRAERECDKQDALCLQFFIPRRDLLPAKNNPCLAWLPYSNAPQNSKNIVLKIARCHSPGFFRCNMAFPLSTYLCRYILTVCSITNFLVSGHYHMLISNWNVRLISIALHSLHIRYDVTNSVILRHDLFVSQKCLSFRNVFESMWV